VTRSRAFAALRLAIIPVLVAVAALIAWKMGYFDLDHRQNLARAVDRIREVPGVHVVFVAVFALAIALCLPVSVGTWVAGAVFGVWLGGALSLACSLVATMLGYWLARKVAKRPLQKLFGEHRLMRKLKNNDGVREIFQLRVIPIAPFAVFTYVSGIAGISVRRLLAATALASIPTCLAHAFVGKQLMQGIASSSGDSKQALLWAAGITVAMLVVSLVIGHTRRKELAH
jgi:uncharacterized membrane protein YdjX (TVP38/TMEM64 family)